jgi:hypothetical protein
MQRFDGIESRRYMQVRLYRLGLSSSAPGVLSDRGREEDTAKWGFFLLLISPAVWIGIGTRIDRGNRFVIIGCGKGCELATHLCGCLSDGHGFLAALRRTESHHLTA